MNLEKEMWGAETKEYNTYTDKYDFGTSSIDIEEAIKIAKQYAEEMCGRQLAEVNFDILRDYIDGAHCSDFSLSIVISRVRKQLRRIMDNASLATEEK